MRDSLQLRIVDVRVAYYRWECDKPDNLTRLDQMTIRIGSYVELSPGKYGTRRIAFLPEGRDSIHDCDFPLELIIFFKERTSNYAYHRIENKWVPYSPLTDYNIEYGEGTDVYQAFNMLAEKRKQINHKIMS